MAAVAAGVTGCGGGAGGYVDAIINNPNSTYTYTVGVGGSGGAGGTNGSNGGTGSAGYIEVTEYYTNLSVGTTTAVAAGTVLAGPISGANAIPTVRALTRPTQQVRRSGTTYTTPTGATLLKITVVGGGAGGGGTATGSSELLELELEAEAVVLLLLGLQALLLVILMQLAQAELAVPLEIMSAALELHLISILLL